MQLTNIPFTDYLTSTTAQANYGADTGGAHRGLLGALVVHSAHAIPHILEVANAMQLKLWVISGGRNFGYGTSLPVAENSVLVDLSKLKGIVHHEMSQTFELEPGVTQQDLAEYLDAHKLEFLIPTTGMGPNGSLIGNALDGGYGLTPVADHFDALSTLEGYWGNGQRFQHSFDDVDCSDMARRWAPGLGPNVQGLLRQGNLGIVTKATLRLARAPEATRVLVLEWPSDEAFYASQDSLSRLTEELPLLGGIISMNGPRILSTMADVPLTSDLTGAQRTAYFSELCRQREVAAWTGIGTLYGPKSTLSGAVSDIRRRLPLARVWAFSPAQIRLLQRLATFFPASWFPAKRRHLGSLVSMLGTVEGRPIVAFLRIAYALDKATPAMNVSRNPAHDGQGILWFAPLVPLTKAGVQTYAATMSAVLAKHGFDPLLAVTTRSSRVHSGTIPLLFVKTPENLARAHRCYRELVEQGLAVGMPPYRIGIDYMDTVRPDADTPTAKLYASLKQLLDPQDVVASGRYVAALGGKPEGQVPLGAAESATQAA